MLSETTTGDPSVLIKPVALSTKLGTLALFCSCGRISFAPRKVKVLPDMATPFRKAADVASKMYFTDATSLILSCFALGRKS